MGSSRVLVLVSGTGIRMSLLRQPRRLGPEGPTAEERPFLEEPSLVLALSLLTCDSAMSALSSASSSSCCSLRSLATLPLAPSSASSAACL
ncbi:hypothetical protein EYF80_056623 [Liparis tanakae]|uniref:Uncharacterized protein n=1 Tax=Liparis tanakae TaxID=230148 RepID=A0A4Z2EWF9_9TELE|nr:hypothetical protein EYF80_056623 [Liparis tanakae]